MYCHLVLQVCNYSTCCRSLIINLLLFSKDWKLLREVTHRNLIRLKETHNNKEIMNTHRLHSLHIQVTVALWWCVSLQHTFPEGPDPYRRSATQSQRTCRRCACECGYSKGWREVTYLCVCGCDCLCVNEALMHNKPGIKQRPVQQGAIIVVANVVRHLHLSGADRGCVVGVGLDAVLRVPHVEQQDVKVEDGVRRDDVTWRGERRKLSHLVY